jgi:hypothetical protein
MLISCLVYPSTMKMEAACFSEMSADFQRTTRRYIPADKTLQCGSCFVSDFVKSRLFIQLQVTYKEFDRICL